MADRSCGACASWCRAMACRYEEVTAPWLLVHALSLAITGGMGRVQPRVVCRDPATSCGIAPLKCRPLPTLLAGGFAVVCQSLRFGRMAASRRGMVCAGSCILWTAHYGSFVASVEWRAKG